MPPTSRLIRDADIVFEPGKLSMFEVLKVPPGSFSSGTFDHTCLYVSCMDGGMTRCHDWIPFNVKALDMLHLPREHWWPSAGWQMS